jgi:hypothetical protein
MQIPFRRTRFQSEYLPPWFYGASYEDLSRGMQIFYPIPFNYLVRWTKAVKYIWDRWRSNYSWLDDQVFKETTKNYKEWRKLNEAVRRDCEQCKVRLNACKGNK